MRTEAKSFNTLRESVLKLPKNELVFLYRCQPPDKEVGLWWTPALFNALNYSLHKQVLLLTVLERIELERKLQQGNIEIPDENEYDRFDDAYFPQFVFKEAPEHIVKVDPLAEFRLMFKGYLKMATSKIALPDELRNVELELAKKFGIQFLRNFHQPQR